MDEGLRQRCIKYSGHVSGLCGLPCGVLDTVKRVFLTDAQCCELCRRCVYPKRDLVNTHLYGSHEAYRWNGRYIYYCPMGLVFVASSVSDEKGSMAASLVAGPLVMGEIQDILAELDCPAMREAVADLPVFTTRRVYDLAELLAAVTAQIAGVPHSKTGAFVYEQDKILNSIYALREQAGPQEDCVYPLEYERRLHRLVGQHDREGSQRLLNELLGYVFVSSDFDVRAIKARVLELIVVLSRATIDAGADPDEILWCNASYLGEVERFDSVEDLSVWLTGVMHRFLGYTFDFAKIKHSDVVHKVMDYCKAHIGEKLTLKAIAGQVYLSSSYLSSLFKEETGESLSGYINRIRVEKSKQLLRGSPLGLNEIAHLCGFEDQSYFTRVFKGFEEISPKKYRDSRGSTL